ncbi:MULTISPECIES: IucA/IucC family siderophore biosynthesis protein [unclassified Streptomyces]|uniref:IucA/IucC family protein n=1 Tax=unclassified Streptomyces TaxID=2593676 RepID=UPI000DB947E3|nr:IucA/IucC family siderophore biosynthesis protein [Streptomyces sp. PsTaAH-137]MYT74183.1 IucA/IucC family siderophore biosynthesis protein [Streptomyces sp. SID8367]RAJ89601.1 siderophore synthetase component [Streptomyces sp. PsTaAH-137]
MPNPSVVPSSGEPPVLYAPPELTPDAWTRAGGRLLAKLIGEFAYEDILRPVADDIEQSPEPARSGYTLAVPGADGQPRDEGPGARTAAGGILRFRARRGAYGSWQVDPASITWTPEPGTDPGPAPEARPFTDPLAFLVRAKHVLGLDGITLGHIIRELTVTLAADARLDHTALTSAQLADLGYAELEGHQTGHPWLVLNKGRLGFSATDTALWAPEGRRPTRLPWIAVHTDLAAYRGATGAGLESAETLYSRELDAETRELFAATLRDRGLDPSAYLYLPVHPWQWDDVVLPLFAPAVAAGAIVPLPADSDVRLPQQSIRTFLNTTRPERLTVKLPLSILNTLVWRGLPTERTLAAPAVTTWMHALRDADPFLRDECRVVLLGEVASVAVSHPLYDGLDEVPYQYKELLGAIWREPVSRQLAPGERARTLASLLHTDPEGRAFTAELVARSGLAPRTWLRRLFAALLPPLLRFLYRYGTVFSPHGENAIVVFDDQDVPVRLAVKDFVDDVNISAVPLPEHDAMPQEVRDVLLTERPDFLTQFIHSGLFVGVFRYLAPLYEEQLGVPEHEFWSLLRAEILHHHARFPELKDRYELFDLLTPQIERLCLNRNRLHLDGYRDRAHRPHAAVEGTVDNPLHQL